MDIDTDHKKFHAPVPVKPVAPRRLRQADEHHELQITLDPNKKYHQRKPITINWNEQKILYKLSQPHGDNRFVTLRKKLACKKYVLHNAIYFICKSSLYSKECLKTCNHKNQVRWAWFVSPSSINRDDQTNECYIHRKSTNFAARFLGQVSFLINLRA